MSMTSALSPVASSIRTPPSPFRMDATLALSPTPPQRLNHPIEPSLLQKARYSLTSSSPSAAPQRAPDGTSGAYFLRDDFGVPFAVFKPTDEEVGALNDNRNLVNPLLPAGGGAIRELAAYLLDQRLPSHARAGVPETHMVANLHHSNFVGGPRFLKTGSLQQFVKSDGPAESVSPSLFMVDDVHRIGILDLRLFNLDRNTENMLLKKSSAPGAPLPVLAGRRASLSGPPCYHLVPIDHAASLPPALHGAFFEWQHWTQAHVPFSKELLDAIMAIDIDEDASLLRYLHFSEDSIRTMMISTMWLQVGASHGLTLSQIASFVAAPLPSQPSALEQILLQIQPLEPHQNSFRSALKDTLEEAATLIKANNQA